MDTVKDNRNKYLGGSEAPIIMGLSPYKTRFELLLEKLGVKKEEFVGNEYTEFGKEMEPKIRDYINSTSKTSKNKYKSDCIVNENVKVRCNVDGVNLDRVLEIKTSTKPNVKNLVYLSQLLFYMHFYELDKGIIAVYKNEGFNTVFDYEKLEFKEYSYQELQDILNVDMDKLVENFWKDYDTLKGYLNLGFELDETMITDNEIQILSNRAVALEHKIISAENDKKELDEVKKKLFELMSDNNFKKWEMPNGTKITRVDATTSTKLVLDEKALEKAIDLEPYKVEKITNRKGYVKITLPNG